MSMKLQPCFIICKGERVQTEAIDNSAAALGTREKGEALIGPAIR